MQSFVLSFASGISSKSGEGRIDDSILIARVDPEIFPLYVYLEDLELAASFRFSKNTDVNKPSSSQFFERYNLGMRQSGQKSYWDLSLRSEFAYRYYVDSIWELDEDILSLSLLRMSTGKEKFKYTYSLVANMAVFPAYTIERFGNNEDKKIRSGGFFDPGDVQLAYGLTWRFWKNSFLNVSMASIKIQSISTYIFPDDPLQIGDYRRLWTMDYGFSLNTRINHKISRRLKWDNQTRFFFNSLERQDMRFDMNNQLRINVIRFFNISLISRVQYFPILNEKIQLLQEFRLGFEWILSPS